MGIPYGNCSKVTWRLTHISEKHLVVTSLKLVRTMFLMCIYLICVEAQLRPQCKDCWLFSFT